MMSEETFRVIPPKKIDEDAVKFMHKFARRCECWLCGRRLSIRVYADHLEEHRAENWAPRVPNSSKKRAEVFAEWQQADATAEELVDANVA